MAMRNLVRRISHPFNYLMNKVCFPKAVAIHSTVATSQKHGDSGGVKHGHHKSRHSKKMSESVGHIKEFHTTAVRPNNYVYNISSTETFNKIVLGSKVPVILDFYSKTFDPCKLLNAILEELVAKKNGALILAKIDIFQLTDIADSFNVTSFPTVIGLKNGREVDKFLGYKDDYMIDDFVDKLAE